MAPKSILKSIQVDAFTRSPFRGRRVAVVQLQQPLDATARRTVGAELGADETVFLMEIPREKGGLGRYELERESAWEAAPAGAPVNAALAAAHMLWTEGQAGHIDRLSFLTSAGELRASKRADYVSIEAHARPPQTLRQAPPLSREAELRYAGSDGETLLLELASEAAVAAYAPSLATVAEGPYAQLIVTARSATPLRDFISRTFVCLSVQGGGAELREAPVDGAAHALLGPYWLGETGFSSVMGESGGSRGGLVHVERAAAADRLYLSGQAVTTIKSLLIVNPVS